MTTPLPLGSLPLTQNNMLETPECFFLRDAGVGDPVEVFIEEGLLLLGSKVAPVWYAAIMIVSDEIVEILLEVRSRAAYRMDLARSNHLGKRDSKLGRAHGPRHRKKHATAGIEMVPPTPRGIHYGCCIEVAVVPLDESGDFSGHVVSAFEVGVAGHSRAVRFERLAPLHRGDFSFADGRLRQFAELID